MLFDHLKTFKYKIVSYFPKNMNWIIEDDIWHECGAKISVVLCFLASTENGAGEATSPCCFGYNSEI